MKALLAAALVAAAPLPAMASGQWSHQRADVKQVEQFIESIGVPVLWASTSSPQCFTKEKNTILYGYYHRKHKVVVMCPAARNNDGGPLALIQHEGWHAIQDVCLNHKATLNDDQIRARLSSSDKVVLRKLYKPHQHRAEAEARAVEHLPTHVFLRGSRTVCSHLLK